MGKYTTVRRRGRRNRCTISSIQALLLQPASRRQELLYARLPCFQRLLFAKILDTVETQDVRVRPHQIISHCQLLRLRVRCMVVMILAYWGQSIQRTTAQWRQWHPNVDEICPMTPISVASPSFPSHTCLCGYILRLTPTMRSKRYIRWMRLFQSFKKGQDQDQHCLLRQTTGHPCSSNRAQQPPWAHSAFQNKIRRS